MLRYLNRGQVITIAQFGRPHNIDREPKLSESTGRFPCYHRVTHRCSSRR